MFITNRRSNMEENKIERTPMSLEEFKKYIEYNGLRTFTAVGIYKSVGRAIKRGHITSSGLIAPKRPFNNRANTSKRKNVHSRGTNEVKKKIYGQIRQYSGSACQ